MLQQQKQLPRCTHASLVLQQARGAGLGASLPWWRPCWRGAVRMREGPKCVLGAAMSALPGQNKGRYSPEAGGEGCSIMMRGFFSASGRINAIFIHSHNHSKVPKG